MERRTQQARTEATRAALLEATIDCLVEHGYAGTTTTRVAERAGVSRGAQVHHFPTKNELVTQAIAYMARKRAQLLLRDWEVPKAGEERTRAALDFLWESHSGPLSRAGIELWVAARTDEDLRGSLAELEAGFGHAVVDVCRGLFGATEGDIGFEATLELALGAIRGLQLMAMLRPLGERDLDREWRTCREQLVPLFEETPTSA